MTTSSEPIVEFHNVTKLYSRNIDRARSIAFRRMLMPWKQHEQPWHSEIYALRNVSFSVRRKERLAILGMEGAGKTTIVRLISGLTLPSSGKVRVRASVRYVQGKTAIERPLMTLRTYLSALASFLGAEPSQLRHLVDKTLVDLSLTSLASVRLRDVDPAAIKSTTFYLHFLVPADLFLLDETILGTFPELEAAAMKDKTQIYFASSTRDLPVGLDRALVLHGREIQLDGTMWEAAALLPRLPPLDETGAVQQVPQEVLDMQNAEDTANPLDGLAPVELGIDPCQALPRRKGTGDARIQSIRVRAQDGSYGVPIRTGDPMTIEFSYRSQDETKALGRLTLANLVVEDENEIRVFGLPSDVIEKDFGDSTPPVGTLRARIPQMPLVPGRYYITISLSLNGIVVDKPVRQASFEVVEGDFFGTGKLPARLSGPIVVPFHWELEPGLNPAGEAAGTRTYNPGLRAPIVRPSL